MWCSILHDLNEYGWQNADHEEHFAIIIERYGASTSFSSPCIYKNNKIVRRDVVTSNTNITALLAQGFLLMLVASSLKSFLLMTSMSRCDAVVATAMHTNGNKCTPELTQTMRDPQQHFLVLNHNKKSY